jgi:uncharacterized SAM-binding protein YcdF (DUF218 family)
MRRRLVVLIVVFAATLAWAEIVHRRSSGRRLGRGVGRAPSSEAIVVLGFKNRGERANCLNRYRVRVGLRSLDPDVPNSVLVLCGGRVGSDIPEAELMARYARAKRGYVGPMRLDSESTTTRENIQNAIPLVEDVESIKIVSNALHAERGRAYLWMLRPDLARRLRRAPEHRFGEIHR